MDSINCPYRQDGLCTRGIYIRPSEDLCRYCLDNKHNERPPNPLNIVRTEPPLPSVTKMAASIAKATVQAIKTGLPQRSPEEIAAINGICKTCEFWRTSDNRCSKCGCYLKFKVAMATEHCPVKKW